MKVFFKGLMCLTICLVADTAYTKSKQVVDDAAIEYALQRGPKTINLTRVVFLKGPMWEAISFQFATDPLFSRLPAVPGTTEEAESGAVQEYRFLLPQTAVKGRETKGFIAQMNATLHPAYHISLEQVAPPTAPIEGLLCTVTFDPKKVGFELRSGISPKGEPCVNFTFYDHAALNLINTRHNTVLNLAHLEAPAQVKKKYA